MAVSSPEIGSGSNARFPWHSFSAEAYHGNNYATLRDDDALMLRRAGEWFARSALRRFSSGMGRFSHGVDVGSGSNLYPALSMLGFCRQITLFEYSAANVEFLKGEVAHLSDSWEPFWDVVSPSVGGRDFEWARSRLRESATVVQGNAFTDLPIGEYDLGTMYFSAESMTEDLQEVRFVTRNFLRALKRESPFVIANMEGSRGYRVGAELFPATPVTVADLTCMLDLLTCEKQVEHIGVKGPSVHLDDQGGHEDDYTGYVLSTGLSF